MFICASPTDPSVISFSNFFHKSPLAACIDFCSTCSLELCGIIFMMLIIAVLFCKVEMPFIIYVFTYQSNHMFLLGSVLIQTLPLMTFLRWSKKMEKLCDSGLLCVSKDLYELVITRVDSASTELLRRLNSATEFRMSKIRHFRKRTSTSACI